MTRIRFKGKVSVDGDERYVSPDEDSDASVMALDLPIPLPEDCCPRIVKDSDHGEFELEIVESGCRFTEVRLGDDFWAEMTEAGPLVDSDNNAFVHAYNFVRVPESPETLIDDPMFARSGSAPHNVFKKERKSGTIACELTTRTHSFIPGSMKSRTANGHQSMGYFTLERMTSDWDADDPSADPTRPALPGSSLRGMIRSVFECATQSCLSVFEDDPLDHRVARVPDSVDDPNDLRGRGLPCYMPCRLLSVSGDHATTQWLDGRFDGDSEEMMRAALIHYYDFVDSNPSGNPRRVWTGNELPALAGQPDGTPVAVRLHERVNRHRRGFEFRKVTDPVALVKSEDEKIEAASELAERWVADASTLYGENVDGSRIILGFFHRTGANFRNKHYERIFFDASASYNTPRIDPAEAIKQFIASHCLASDVSPEGTTHTVLDEDVVQNLRQHLRGYADRNNKKLVGAPRPIREDREPNPSDFVVSRPEVVELGSGDLLYGLLEQIGATETSRQSSKVHGLFPTALPRLTHENSRSDLLCDTFYPCSRQHERCDDCCQLWAQQEVDQPRKLCASCKRRHENLCPACRVFGWTRHLTAAAKYTGSNQRVDAVAGHVAFSHAVLDGELPGPPVKVTLPSLSSPNPTATGFYLREIDASAKRQRWPPMLRELRSGKFVDGYHWPSYRTDEAVLRGRKFYRRRQRAAWLNGDEVANAGTEKHNQTIHALPPQLAFKFEIRFDNLTEQELAALLYSLTLPTRDTPSEREFGRPMHMVGHGKPLGMGVCEISIKQLSIDRHDRFTAANWERYGQTATVDDTDRVSELVQPFWDAVDRNPTIGPVIEELTEMLRVVPEAVNVRYPPSPATGDEPSNFKWWKGAKNRGVRLPEPGTEKSIINNNL